MRQKSSFFSKDQAGPLAETLKAMGHPIRLQLVDILALKPRSVGELADLTSVPQALISQQLKILRMVGLVAVERRDGHSFYKLNNPHIIELLQCLRRCERSNKKFGPKF